MRSTLINQVQGAGISTLQQKKNWLIDWYFSNDPMGSIYLATLRNSALVSTYQTNPGMLYGTPFATGMENYFQKIKNYFGQSMFDQLVTEFAQQSNLYVDEIKVDEFHLYGSNRLGVYEANKTISRRVARDLNNDKQISNNEYIIETPEEVLYLYSSYQLERGAKRYELSNHLGNVLTVISDKKTANFTGATFTQFSAERISATDYSPFGAPLAGRTWNAQEYMYGFNTQERDDEIAGIGNIMTAQFWEYDTRLGRRWNVDPKPQIVISDYSCLGDNPVRNVDPKGDDKYKVDKDGNITLKRKTNKSYDKLVGSGRLFNKSIKLEKGLLDSKEAGYGYDPRIGDFDYDKFLTKNISEGQRLFEFLANNTNVEWTYAKFENNLLSYGRIFTSHHANTELGFTDFANKYGIEGLTGHDHNHPGPSHDKRPSGQYLDPNDPIEAQFRTGDVGLAKKIEDVLNSENNKKNDLMGIEKVGHAKPVFRIYTSDNVYTTYHSNTYVNPNLIVRPKPNSK